MSGDLQFLVVLLLTLLVPSYSEYLGKPKNVDTDFALDLFNSDRNKVQERFESFHQEINDDVCLDVYRKLCYPLVVYNYRIWYDGLV